MTPVEVAKPEWLEESIPAVQKTLELIADGRIPKSILGFMVRTSAMRLLRCLYGSDLETAAAIRAFVLEKEEMWMAMEAEEAK